MAGNQAVGDGLSADFAGMTKSQIYDMMSQMKTLIEQNPEQARQILIQNPHLTKALFHAQIMLGMVLQHAPQPTPSQPPPLPVQPVQQASIQAPHVSQGQNGLQDQVIAPQHPIRKQQQNPPMMPISSTSSPPVSLPPQSLPPHTSQSLQQSHAQSSQLFNLPSSQPPMVSGSQLSQPLQTSGIQHLPLPPQTRPSFTNQHHSQTGQSNLGFQHSGQPHLHHSQPMFHMGPSSGGPSFQQGQPPLPSQPPPQSMYQPGGSHVGPEFNSQVGKSMQPERGGSSWIPGLQDNTTTQGMQLPGPPPMTAGQMGQGSQPPRPPPLTPDMEKALLQQVMSLTPDQINHLPPEQRTQVLQLQQMLRQ